MEPTRENTLSRTPVALLVVGGIVAIAIGLLLLLVGLHGNYYCSFYPEIPCLFYPMGGAVLLILGIVILSAAAEIRNVRRKVEAPS